MNSAPAKVDAVYPSVSIVAENPVAVGAHQAGNGHWRNWPRPTRDYLYSDEAQEIAVHMLNAAARAPRRCQSGTRPPSSRSGSLPWPGTLAARSEARNLRTSQRRRPVLTKSEKREVAFMTVPP